ncbi:MAG TPA: response regulator, partial [Longimicrobiaceae bacterium]
PRAPARTVTGLREASRLMREIERILERGGSDGVEPDAAAAQMVAALRRELERTAAPAAPREDGRRRMLLVDRDAAFAQRVAAEAALRGVRVEVAADAFGAWRSLAAGRPEVVLLDLSGPEDAAEGRKLLEELAGFRPSIPVLVLTHRSTLDERLAATRLGGRGFLRKPAPPAQVVEAALELLPERDARFRVLAVDDDPAVLDGLRSLLEVRGYQVATLPAPLRFWEALERTRPDLLVLDVDMPHLGGIELCRVLRNDLRWRELPVVLLTDGSDADTVHRVFGAGADDFVSKPVVGPELVARVASRLARRRRPGGTAAEADPLTGLPGRRAASTLLVQLLRLADRFDQPLALAVLNVDRLRDVNDLHGTDAGDAVLRRLGETLLRHFRGEDVCARWSASELVVGMYGMEAGDAARRLEALRAAFHAEEFTGRGGARFRAACSTGLAVHPQDGTDLASLLRAAGFALQQARAAGRDRPGARPPHPGGNP